MQDIGKILGNLGQDFPNEIAGKSTGGGFDGPPVPSTRQYRATVIKSEWYQAKSSGKWSYSLTFEITAPEEFAGKKFSEYYSIDENTNAIGREKFARLIGESGINIKDADTSSNEAFAKEFEGKEFVIATRIWGDEMDRNGLRYLNKDRGQKLLDKIDPPKNEQLQKAKLKADIKVNKDAEAAAPAEEPEEESAEYIEQPIKEQEQVRLPGGNRPNLPNLPPGLRGGS